jgi:hypothetical protein
VAGQTTKPAGKQATHWIALAALATTASATHRTPAAGAGFNKLTVTVTVVFTNAYVVKVEETINWFLLMMLKNRLSLM